MNNKIITFESRFDKPEKFNSQFHMVKIYIAYAGKNRNGSIISKETFEKLIPSLYGVPVVGEWKGEDFGSHGGKIEISEDGIQYIDTTKPYGFIDSSATVQWEDVTEEDGTVREYLTTSAFLWTSRYPEVLKVLENKNNQSMEINVFDGSMSEEYPEYFEILDGEFSALCILGEEIEGCFESAKVSQFNLDKDTFKSEFTQMVAELKTSLNFTVEGGENVGEENKNKFEDEIVEVKEEATEEFAEDVTEEVEETTVDTSKEIDEEVTEEEIVEEDFELKYNELLEKFNELEVNYKTLETEVVGLREFKAQKDKEEFEAKQEELRQEKINHINTEYEKLSDDIKELFISKIDDYESTDDIDADICVYIVKNKVTFSKAKKESTPVKVSVEETTQNPIASPYGDLF